MAFKQDVLTENDITEFVKECRKYRHKLQRRIIIAFRDIDANAKLRALEEKILTWDLNNLNQILDLFSKPRVIL
jgi:predicted helicase